MAVGSELIVISAGYGDSQHKGQININLRYRFEHVNQDGLKTANGDPIRLRLGYLSPKLTGFQAYAEVLGNTPIFLDDFDDSSNGKTDVTIQRNFHAFQF